MLRIDYAIEFLIRHNALELGASPWDTYSEMEDTYPVAWDRLFPRPSRGPKNERDKPDPWEPEIGGEFLDQLGSIARAPQASPPGHRPQPDTPIAEWDHCAWYQPIHFYGYEWGIFIREDCVRRQALALARFVPPNWGSDLHALAKRLLRASVYAYFLHEHYHHKVESLGFRLHVTTGTSTYPKYTKDVYEAAVIAAKDGPLEEALANADIYLRLSTPPYSVWITKPIIHALKDYLRWSFPLEPPGYCKAIDYLRHDNFEAGENQLQGQVHEALQSPKTPSGDWNLAPRLMQSFFPVTSNIWTVVRGGQSTIMPTRRVAPAPSCSTRELMRLFTEAGYTVVPGGKGSHVKLAKPGASMMILPGDRCDLSPGVLKTALKVLGGFRLADLPRLLSRKE